MCQSCQNLKINFKFLFNYPILSPNCCIVSDRVNIIQHCVSFTFFVSINKYVPLINTISIIDEARVSPWKISLTLFPSSGCHFGIILPFSHYLRYGLGSESEEGNRVKSNFYIWMSKINKEIISFGKILPNFFIITLRNWVKMWWKFKTCSRKKSWKPISDMYQCIAHTPWR